jgi:hypothetical protein
VPGSLAIRIERDADAIGQISLPVWSRNQISRSQICAGSSSWMSGSFGPVHGVREKHFD